MIKDFWSTQQVDKHARHVESAHRELSIHARRLGEKPTAGELQRLLVYQLRPRLSRHHEIRNCQKRGPAFAAKFPDHHTHAEACKSSLEKLIDCANSIIAKYYFPDTHEVECDRALDPADQKTILDAIKLELEN